MYLMHQIKHRLSRFDAEKFNNTTVSLKQYTAVYMNHAGKQRTFFTFIIITFHAFSHTLPSLFDPLFRSYCSVMLPVLVSLS